MGRKVVEKSSAGYSSIWRLQWIPFVSKLEFFGPAEDFYLETASSDKERSMVVVLFMAERYEGGFRGERVFACLSAVKHFFTLRFVDTRFLDSDVVAAGRSGAKLRAADLRLRADRGSDRSALPLPYEVLEVMRVSLFLVGGWTSSEDLDNKAKYLANVLGFDKAARIKNYTRREGKGQDHCVKGKDVRFVVEARPELGQLLETPRMFSVTIGPELQLVTMDLVLGLDLVTVSGKNKECHGTRSISRRSPGEIQFLEDMLLWCQRSGVGLDDDLFTRVGTDCRGKLQKRSLLSRDVNDAMKITVAQLGLHPRFALAHGKRKGGITTMLACGATRDQISYTGGHSERSRTSEEVYQYAASGVGALASMGLSGASSLSWSLEHCKRLGAFSFPVTDSAGEEPLFEDTV